MNKYADRLISQETSQKKDTLWYTAGSMSSALFSMLISLAVTRILGANQAGVFAIAWAAAQLMWGGFPCGNFKFLMWKISLTFAII